MHAANTEIADELGVDLSAYWCRRGMLLGICAVAGMTAYGYSGACSTLQMVCQTWHAHRQNVFVQCFRQPEASAVDVQHHRTLNGSALSVILVVEGSTTPPA